MVGHLFQNYHTIYVGFFPTYTCNHSCYKINVCFFCHVYLRFIPKYMTIFLQTRIYMRTKKPYICVTNKHVVYAVAESLRIRGTELYRQQKTSSCTMELKSNIVWIKHAAMPALIWSKICFLFIVLTVVMVVGSPTTDLLESMDCLLRDCVRYFTNADRNNDRFS